MPQVPNLSVQVTARAEPFLWSGIKLKIGDYGVNDYGVIM